MSLKKNVKMIVTRQRPIIDVWHYMIGNYRFKLYYSRLWRFLLKKHIYEQITLRLTWMNQTCYNRGSCVKCGCDVPQLQMCSKSCDAKCYPKMLNRKDWGSFKGGRVLIQDKDIWLYHTSNNKIELVTHHN